MPLSPQSFRPPDGADLDAVEKARAALAAEPDFGPGLPARPNEPIPPGNTWTIQPSLFGAVNYGDLCNDRQTLGFVRLARTINELGAELLAGGVSPDYAAALGGYAGSALVRKMRRSTCGEALQVYADGRTTGVHDAAIPSDAPATAANQDSCQSPSVSTGTPRNPRRPG